MTANQVEIAVANEIGYRANIIVPNVSWGLAGLLYEADMVVLRDSMWADEIEIKVSASDIVADTHKWHSHDYRHFKRLYFAVPESLAGHAAIPERAGIYSVKEDRGCFYAKKIREARLNPDAQKFTPKLMNQLLRLAAMRTWTLKKHLASMQNYYRK